MAEEVFNQQKVAEYQDLIKKHEKVNSDLIKAETVLEEKQKKLKEVVTELKSLGVPIDNIAGWQKETEKSLLTDMDNLKKALSEAEALLQKPQV